MDGRGPLIIGYETTVELGGSKGTVRLKANKRKRQKIIRVELRKGAFATKWHVVGYDESDVVNDPSDNARSR